jgi:hypothetical protein
VEVRRSKDNSHIKAETGFSVFCTDVTILEFIHRLFFGVEDKITKLLASERRLEALVYSKFSIKVLREIIVCVMGTAKHLIESITNGR